MVEHTGSPSVLCGFRWWLRPQRSFNFFNLIIILIKACIIYIMGGDPQNVFKGERKSPGLLKEKLYTQDVFQVRKPMEIG